MTNRDAIKWLNNLMTSIGEPQYSSLWHYIQPLTKINDMLLLLPSAQAVEVVRCKDCKWLSMTTLGMEYACWHGAEKVWGETGEHKDHTVCQRIDSLDHYCSYGERRSE